MGDLKPQDPTISSTEPIVKRPRGNPGLKKGVRNPYYTTGTSETKEKNMAEEAEVIKEKTTPNPEVTGEKKVIPNDVFSDEIPSAEVLPLDGQVVEKAYASLADPTNPNQPKTDGGGGGSGIKPPVTPGTENLGGNGTGTPLGDPTATATPSAPMEGAKTPEQVKTEAEQFVKLLLRGYDKLHAVGRWAGKMDPNDLMLLHQKRKIDLDYNLPLGTGTIGLRKFFSDYNAQIEEDIVVTDEFKNDITPPLTRIAIKRGWGLGDEGTVGLLLAEDLGTKVALLWGLKKTCNMVLESCMAIMKSQNEAVDARNNPKKEPEKKTEDFIPDKDSWREAPTGDNIEDANIVK